MIVVILDVLTVERRKSIDHVDHKKLVMASCNEGMKCENARTLNDSFFMFFQHTAAAKKFDGFFWHWRVGREGFLQCGGHFGPVEKYNACIVVNNIFPTQMDSHFINITWNRTVAR